MLSVHRNIRVDIEGRIKWLENPEEWILFCNVKNLSIRNCNIKSEIKNLKIKRDAPHTCIQRILQPEENSNSSI